MLLLNTIRLLLSTSLASASTYADIPLPPSQDPFYTAPAGFETARPGQVLRLRVAPGNLTSLVANSSEAYHVLFRTTDSRYNPSWAVTTLFVPCTASANDSGTPLLSYQIPYNTANVDASPSYLYYGGPEALPPLSFSDVSTALGYGWYVNVPDFEGPLAAYAAGVQAGHATIDSIRAVQSLDLGLQPNATVVLWGYSGGSFASAFAAELAVQYAPELNISGLALGGLLVNLTETAEIPGEIQPPGVLGLTAQYPEARAHIIDQLHDSGPYNKSTFLAGLHTSAADERELYGNQSIWPYFRDGEGILRNPMLLQIVHSETILGYHGTPQAPLFVYKAVHDEATPIASTDALVERWCGVGTDVLYQRNMVGGHGDEARNGDPRALDWLKSVFEGTRSVMYTTGGCRVENVTWEEANTGFRRGM